jgi:hypothetical protein
LIFSQPAYGASLNDIAPALHKKIECMAKVVKTVPLADQIRTGVEDRTRDASAMYMRVLPFVEYRFPSRYGGKSLVRFEAVNEDPLIFQAPLSGLTVAGKPPDDLGSGIIIPKWKAVCGVSAVILFP